jgi:hypothetical protein
MSWSPVQGVLPPVNDQETEKSAICSDSGSKLTNGNKEEEEKNMFYRHDFKHTASPLWNNANHFTSGDETGIRTAHTHTHTVQARVRIWSLGQLDVYGCDPI